MWLVELGAPGGDEAPASSSARWLDLPVPRPLSLLRGTLAELLDDPAHEGAREHWVKAVLTDTVRPLDPMRRLQTRFPYCAMLEFDPEGRAHRDEASYGERVRRAPSDVELVDGFLEHVRGAGLAGHERRIITEALGDLDGVGA